MTYWSGPSAFPASSKQPIGTCCGPPAASIATTFTRPAHAMLKTMTRPYGVVPATTGCFAMMSVGMVKVYGPVGSSGVMSVPGTRSDASDPPAVDDEPASPAPPPAEGAKQA